MASLFASPDLATPSFGLHADRARSLVRPGLEEIWTSSQSRPSPGIRSLSGIENQESPIAVIADHSPVRRSPPGGLARPNPPSRHDNPKTQQPSPVTKRVGFGANSAGWTLVGAASSRDSVRRVNEHDRQIHSARTRQKRGMVRIVFGLAAVSSTPSARGFEHRLE
jgi:hypothetical protein